VQTQRAAAAPGAGPLNDWFSIVVAAGLGGLGAIFLMWLRAQFAPKDDVSAMQRQVDALATAVSHIGSDQSEHKTHGNQITELQTDVKWLKRHAENSERHMQTIGKQNAAIYNALKKLAPGEGARH